MAGMKDGDFGSLDHKLPLVTVANGTIVGTLEALLSCNDPEYPSYTDGRMRFVRAVRGARSSRADAFLAATPPSV